MNRNCSSFIKKILFVNERIFDENDENFAHYIYDDARHHFVQLLLIDFVIHTISLRIEIRVNMKYNIIVINIKFKFFK